ncbi:MAG: hypothetical protein MI861_09335 [Pirellulales bacterium]|nr:hypothetical protein [Pirellulales bacterium]
MGGTPFRGAKLKVSRAYHQILEFQDLMQAFFDNNPHRIEVHKNPENHSFRLSAVFDEPIPDASAAIVGDAIHNMRCALDHLAHEIVERSPGGEIDRFTGFPIYETEADFNGGIDNKLRGITRKARDVVVATKPYKTGNNEPGNFLLWAISQLDNRDKHKLIIPVISIIAVDEMRAWNDQGVSMRFGNVRLGGDGRINIVTLVGIPGMQFEINGDVTFVVKFGDTGILDDFSVPETLRDMADGVIQIIRAFEEPGIFDKT